MFVCWQPTGSGGRPVREEGARSGAAHGRPARMGAGRTVTPCEYAAGQGAR